MMDGADLPPITDSDRALGFPASPLYFFLYALCERKWAINNPIDNTPDKNGKAWPQDINFVLKVSCDNINLKDLLEFAEHEFSQMRMKISWKKTQMKQSTLVIAILGLPAELNLEGVVATIGYGLKQAREYLITKGSLDFQQVGKNMPNSSMNYRKTYLG